MTQGAKCCAGDAPVMHGTVAVASNANRSTRFAHGTVVATAARYGSAGTGALGGTLFSLSSLWFLSRLGDQPHYWSEYLPGMLVSGIGVGLVLPALTTLATAT